MRLDNNYRNIENFENNIFKKSFNSSLEFSLNNMFYIERNIKIYIQVGILIKENVFILNKSS